MTSEDASERVGNEYSPTLNTQFPYRTIVQVYVGPERRLFHVHKECLCSASPFFAAALERDFLEAHLGSVKLPEQDVESFQYFVHWLYRGKLSGYFEAKTMRTYQKTNIEVVHAGTDSSQSTIEVTGFEGASITHLASLYVLADALLIRGLRDHIVTFIVKVCGLKNEDARVLWNSSDESGSMQGSTLNMSDAYEILESIEACNPLRRFIIDLCANNQQNPASAWTGHLRIPFCLDLLAKLRPMDPKEVAPIDFRISSTVCQYHVHDVRCSLTTDRLAMTEIQDW